MMPPGPRNTPPWEAPGWRRGLQLALAGLWLLDAVLQYQTFMFSQGFPRMLAATAAGNPAGVADPVTWSAHLIGTHPGAANAAFATLQLLLALGIAWRPTTRAALAASVVKHGDSSGRLLVSCFAGNRSRVAPARPKSPPQAGPTSSPL